ncbi:MAG: protein kinase [Pirellulales bacterium]|nr:protein kinase [Pirellulales bacterium]
MPDVSNTHNKTLSPGDLTVEIDPGSNVAGLSSSPTVLSWFEAAGGVELVKGSAPELTRETQDLLRSRLRTATLVLFAGFAAFLVLHALYTDFSQPVAQFLFGFHMAATVVLGLVAASLCRRCDLPMWWMRVAEWAAFGLPTIFFLVVQYFVTLDSCRGGVLDFPEGLWLVLIYTYALFIPNSLRRASVAIGLMCLLPLGLLFGMMWLHPVVAEHVSVFQIARLLFLFCMAGIGGVLGVDIIGALRREAFEARQLGQYRLTRLLGAGGMGEVFLAEHQLLKRPCVVKLIRPDKTGNPKVLARFQREVRATAKLSHWNTVEIFDYGCTADGTFYYVMEYLPGMSLGEIVDRFGPLPPERVIYLLRQACDALAEAHAAGLIHRDIKPGNIFVSQRGGVYDVVKLLDFGLVKPIFEEESIHLTAEGTITGSPLFISPEQALGESRPDGRSDIYSLGAVGYFLLTGLPPFAGEKAIKVIFAHAHDPVVPPRRHDPDIPADLEAVVLRCLEKNPAERFQSAAEMADALAECGAADGWDRRRAAEWWSRREEPVAAEASA